MSSIMVSPRLGDGGSAAKPRPAALTATRIRELDGVRGLACLLILGLHYLALQVKLGRDNPFYYPLRLLAMNWTGVDLFFVLSGFLLGGILLDHRRSPNLFTVFYVRRTARIFPVYFAWLGLFILLPSLLNSEAYTSLFSGTVPLWSYATYLQNFYMASQGTWGGLWMAGTWSLAVEEQFYLVLPALIRFVPARRLPGVLLLLILSGPVSRLLVSFYFPGHYLAPYFLLPCRWDSLFLGVLGAWLLRQEHWRSLLERQAWFVYSLLGLLAVGMVCFVHKRPGNVMPVMVEFGYTWVACFYLVLLWVVLRKGLVARFFRSWPLVFVGTISYSVYLFHGGVAGLLHGACRGFSKRVVTPSEHPADWAITALALGVTFLVAWLSYQFFERPFIRLGHRCKYAEASPGNFQEALAMTSEVEAAESCPGSAQLEPFADRLG